MKQGRDLKVGVERWPIRGGFTISRGAKHEAVVVVATISDGVASGQRRMRPLCPLWRERRGRGRARSRLARLPSRPASTAPGFRPCCRLARRATRSTARCGISRRRSPDEARPSLPASRRSAPVETAFTISLASPEEMAARGAGRGALSAAQAQAWRRWRRSAACRGARRRAQCTAHRRRQRGVARVRPRAPAGRGEGGGRRAHRAAAARRRRRSARAYRPNRPGLRRRVGA